MTDEKEKKAGRLPRFVIRGRTLGWSLVTLILCMILYLLLGGLVSEVDGKLVWNLLDPVKSLLVVVISILGTTLVTVSVIEKKSRNEIFTDTLLDELSLSAAEYNRDRKKLLENLEQNHYFDGNRKKREIYESIVRRRDIALQHTYATKNYHRVVCTIHPDRIEKEIVREVCIRSYESTYKEEEFVLAGQVVKSLGEVSGMEVQEVTINGVLQELDVDYKFAEDSTHVGSLDRKNEYSIRRDYRCMKPLVFSSDEDTKIVVKYKTVAPPDDFTYSIRMRRPCKDYTLEFRVNDDLGRKCSLKSHAFGFCEDAINTLNDSDPHSVSIRFEDWIFYNDGVCISFYPISDTAAEKSEEEK